MNTALRNFYICLTICISLTLLLGQGGWKLFVTILTSWLVTKGDLLPDVMGTSVCSRIKINLMVL